MVLSVVLGLLGVDAGQGASVGVTSVAQIRRLHDLGRSGWWILALLALEAAAAFGGIAALGENGGLIVAGLAGLIPLVALGAIPGQAFENRFGPAPGQKSLAETFS